MALHEYRLSQGSGFARKAGRAQLAVIGFGFDFESRRALLAVGVQVALATRWLLAAVPEPLQAPEP